MLSAGLGLYRERRRPKSGKEAGMAGADNPNRVSRLNKDPFVLGTSFDPSDVFAHPEQ